MTGGRRENAGSFVFPVAGAVAGVGYHQLTYPVGTIKSNVQAGMGWEMSLTNSLVVSKPNGYWVVLARAMGVNASRFYVYEQARKYAKYS